MIRFISYRVIHNYARLSFRHNSLLARARHVTGAAPLLSFGGNASTSPPELQNTPMQKMQTNYLPF